MSEKHSCFCSKFAWLCPQDKSRLQTSGKCKEASWYFVWEIQVINTGFSKVPWVCSYISITITVIFKEPFNFKNKNNKQSLPCARDLNTLYNVYIQLLCLAFSWLKFLFSYMTLEQTQLSILCLSTWCSIDLDVTLTSHYSALQICLTLIPEHILKTWRGGAADMRTCYSSRGPEFKSKHLHESAHKL